MDKVYETESTLQDDNDLPKGTEKSVDRYIGDTNSSKNESRSTEADQSNWKYQDGWPEDQWQKEFERHPFFMTKSPDPTADMHPLLEGLQHLKYGEEDNTAEELAQTYKKDGLLSFKVGKYRDAILNFTTALKYQCSDELKSQLYNNRAASHFFLANYRSSLQDSREAVKLNPNYMKAKLRIPHCLFYLGNYRECIDHCEKILNEDKNNAEIKQLQNNAEEKKKFQDRDHRKLQKKLRDEEKLIEAIRNRNIHIKIRGEDLNSVAQLEPPVNPPGLERVRLGENSLIWSAIIAFPEPRIFECVQSFHEDITFSEILEDIFEAIHTEWDTKNQYTENTVNIYFKDERSLPVKVPITSTLLSVQHHPRYFQDSGVLQFFILINDSASEKEFLEDCYRTSK